MKIPIITTMRPTVWVVMAALVMIISLVSCLSLTSFTFIPIKFSSSFCRVNNNRIITTATLKRTRRASSSSNDNINEHIEGQDIKEDETEKEFLTRTKILCSERNLPLHNIKNARDIATVRNSPVQPRRIYRMGRLSDASDSDLQLLMEDIGLKTLVDLRSPTELKDDGTLEREEVFGDFVSMVWSERRRGRRSRSRNIHSSNGVVKELKRGQPRIQRRGRKRKMMRDLLKRVKGKFVKSYPGLEEVMLAATTSELVVGVEEKGDDVDEKESEEDYFELCCGEEAVIDDDEEDEEDEPECDIDDVECRSSRKERHFVSLMNELKYVRGTISKLRKRDLARAVLKSPGAIVSRRVRHGVKSVFLDEINGGGLPMLNELLLRYGAKGICYVLELCADRTRHPVAFHCTAGKDRTGAITAIILALLGVPDEDIVEDYSLSANVYAEMNDHQAMVGALSQRNLDAKTFLGAPPQVMRDTLEAVRESYGSVEDYCDFIGFGPEKREKLRDALLSP